MSQLGVNHATDFYTLHEGEFLLCRPAASSAEQDILMSSSHQQQQPQSSTPDPFPPCHPLPSYHPDPPYYAGADINDPDGNLMMILMSMTKALSLPPLAIMEFNSSHCCVINIDSSPKVVGHKCQYAASLSPPLSEPNLFILLWKPQTPAHHSHAAFGTSSTIWSGGQALCRPSLLASSSGISCSLFTPSLMPSSYPTHHPTITFTDSITDFTFGQATELNELEEEENVSGGHARMHYHGE
ncbi:hypothetical protein BDR07DRAFT_1491856 [Suillus spraguei]|nr:hypothetical protein BDR07DRAFT_1491856 [Suillus spraguei]